MCLFVCSFHFFDRQPTAQNPIPELFLGYGKVVKKRRLLVRSACEAEKEELSTTQVKMSGQRSGSAQLQMRKKNKKQKQKVTPHDLSFVNTFFGLAVSSVKSE